jgi:sodium-dependent phosphate transporter
MHESAEKFDPRTEQVFKVLQVISACAMSFAHGANDVANSIGSFCAAFYVYKNMAVPAGEAEVRASVQDSVHTLLTLSGTHHTVSGSTYAHGPNGCSRARRSLAAPKAMHHPWQIAACSWQIATCSN